MPFALILFGLFVVWRITDTVVAHRRLRALLRARGIVRAPHQRTAARINPGLGRMLVTCFDGLEHGRPCFVVATKSFAGFDVELSVSEPT